MAKKVILVVLLFFTVFGYFYVNQYPLDVEKVIEPIEAPPISIEDTKEDTNNIHFFCSGFAINHEEGSRFYDFDGNPIDVPLIDDNDQLHKESITIDSSTDNYMIIDDKYLYDTSKIPFELILEAPQNKAWDIKEFDENLLLIAKTENNNLEPYIMEKSNNALYRIDGLGDLAYIDGDYCQSVKGLSIIALNMDNPFPSTKIFHFTDMNVPYGVLSIDDDIFYKIHRYDEFFVVIGLHKIQCYDLTGNLKWEVKIPHSYNHQLLIIDNSLAFYFNNIYIKDQNNTMILTKEGGYRLSSLPRGLHHLKRYQSGYIGILGKKTIIKLNSKGNIEKKYELDTDIKDIYWTPHSPDNIYIYTADNQINIYSITPLKERDESE